MNRNTFISILRIFGFIILFFVILALITYFEKGDESSSITSLFDAFWYAVVTLTTVGYGDFYPVTIGGKVVGLILILFSLGLLGYVISSLTNNIRNYMENKRLGHFGTKMENHVVIIGWNNFGKLIVDQIVRAKQKVAIITDNKNDIDLIYDLFDKNKVFVLFSDIDHFESFTKVRIEQSSSVYINIPDDTESLVYLLNLKKSFTNLNIVVSLSNAELRDTFYSAGAKYVISEKEISSKLIASFIFEPDVANYTDDLITTAVTDQGIDMLEFKVIDKNPYLNANYLDAFIDLKKKHNSILVGISKLKDDYYHLYKNPSINLVIEQGDYLLLICDGNTKRDIEKDFGVEEGRMVAVVE